MTRPQRFRRIFALFAVFTITTLGGMPTSANAVVQTGTTVGGIGPGGGVIFYDAGSQQSWGRYLEVAPSNWSGASEMSGVWCVPPTNVGTAGAIGAGPASFASGAGKTNTGAIITACGGNTAAGFAAGYQGGGLTDWYLPSQDEIVLLYENRGILNSTTAGSFAMTGNYWSSSANPMSPGNAWAQDMTNGYRLNNPMNNIYKVRPIRAISDPSGGTAPSTAPQPSPSATAVSKPCVPGGPCSVGRIGPGRGIVFYDAGAEQPWGRYLEAAPANWNSSTRRFTAVWCIDTADVETGVAIGDGADNTDAIIETCDRGGITAAEYASRYRGGKKRDWYLPSKAEMDALITSRLVTLRGNYWTSSQVVDNAGQAYTRNGASSQTAPKQQLQGVWPIRAF